MMENAANQATDGSESADAFDIVVVPHGAVDKKLVVGSTGRGKTAKVDGTRVRSAMREWLRVGDFKIVSGDFKRVSLALNGVREAEDQASPLLGDLSETMARLASARAEFRQELLAAVAEGEALFKQAAG